MRIRLRELSTAESDALVAGAGVPPVGLRWDEDYPSEDTLVALGLLRLAHAAAGRPSAGPRWWLQQIVVEAGADDVVVGDIGFHGPPEPGPPLVVEIGYHVVPGWRGRGVATGACRLLLEQAWSDGADVIRAEAVSAESAAVLGKCGFRELGDGWFEVRRP